MSAESATAKGADDLVAAGKRGKKEGNIHRDIRRTIKNDSAMPQPYLLPVPCHDPDTNKNQQIFMIPVLLIHEMLIWMITSTRVALSSIVGTALDITSGHFASLKKFCSEHELPFEKTVCCGLHSDGVPFASNQTVEVFSWNFTCAPHMERILFGRSEKLVFVDAAALDVILWTRP